tara:strand:- start:439 stop:666 length:228 start_codon:yes stop_codon:yes gene_type:complete
LYQQSSDSKGKEGQIARDIIDMLTLEDSIVTLDALHCQRDTLDLIRQHKGKKDSMAAKRRGAAWNGEFRSELLFG